MLLRIALTDHGGKWVPGTILGVYPDGMQLNWGEKTLFLLAKVPDAKDMVAFQTDVLNRRLAVNLDALMPPEEKGQRLAAKATVQSAEVAAFVQEGIRTTMATVAVAKVFGGKIPAGGLATVAIPVDKDDPDIRTVADLAPVLVATPFTQHREQEVEDPLAPSEITAEYLAEMAKRNGG